MLVRTDLNPEQIIVQASHACFDAGRFFMPSLPGEDANGRTHPNFVLIGVPDEETLLQEAMKIMAFGVDARIFVEPDLDGQSTALATEPISGDQRRFFRKYRLLKMKGQS